MVLTWQAVDLHSDPDTLDYPYDPAEMVEAVGILAELLQHPAWHAQAACRGQGPAAWFPPRGYSPAPARAVCADCPVQAECLDAATADPTTAGVWAGTSESERRAVRGRRDEVA